MALHVVWYVALISSVVFTASSEKTDSNPRLTGLRIKIVTWNVADNKGMGGSFTNDAIDNVLGLSDLDTVAPSLYAIGLQENCYLCNEGNMGQLAQLFVDRINDKMLDKYSLIGTQGTRMSRFCQFGCKFGTHGSSILIVIGKIDLGATFNSFAYIHGCSSKFIPNAEKGFAAMKVRLLNGKTLCFANNHLDSKKSSYRRNCIKGFFNAANEEDDWSSKCDAQFLFGDFNTRTGDKTDDPSDGKHYPITTDFSDLRKLDELTGSTPYGTDSSWKGHLLGYINHVQSKRFTEQKVNFIPTYSVKSSREFCDGLFPCYRVNRPLSWTDRIVHTGVTRCEKYEAILKEYGDHFPVTGLFVVV